MGRRLVKPGVNIATPKGYNAAAAKAVEALVAPHRPRRKSRPSARDTIERAITEVNRRLDADDWTKLTATTMLQLWVWCHAQVYDVRPVVKPKEWERWLMRVGSMCRDQFGGDYDAMLVYVRWAWGREEGYEDHRRRNNQSRPPMGVYKLFGDHVLTDYRIEKARGNV
ncbi:MAG: hypothetical protein ACTSXZ_06175 [Alphaproteobacteria bacterium]